MTSALKQIVILSRNLRQSQAFYAEVLHLTILRSSAEFVEFDTSSGIPLSIKQVDGKKANEPSHFPLLNFTVSDLSHTVSRALELGAELDGPIRHHTYGKIAAIKTPDGNMIGIFEEP